MQSALSLRILCLIHIIIQHAQVGFLLDGMYSFPNLTTCIFGEEGTSQYQLPA
jgi:hypothetical protein